MKKFIFKFFRYYLLGSLFLCFPLLTNFDRTDDPMVSKIIYQLGLFSKKSMLQKVYVHTDKDVYITGESVWLKAYLLNASSFLPETSSNEIYVDLIGRNNNKVESIILRNIDGVANGDIILNDSIPEGNYQLVAYTNWMKNFDDDFFFSKTIRIVNPGYSRFATKNSINIIKKYNQDLKKAEETKTLLFFPEGGTIVAGLECRVAFKAANMLGYGIFAKGEIFDDLNKKIVNMATRHLGMGSFNFTPEKGRKYYAKIVFGDGKPMRFDLPEVAPAGYTMMVNPLVGDQIRITIQSSGIDQSDEKSSEIIIVGQSRGSIQYLSKGVMKGKPINATVSKKLFPAGIAQITLFNGKGEPVCERLIFIKPDDVLERNTLKVNTESEGNDIVLKIHISNAEGKPSAGNLSLSVSQQINDSIPVWRENILSNLLLTSDLKGRVENATGYFNESNTEALMNLDYVMLINGWRRFVWKEILAGYFPSILYSPSEGLEANKVSTSILLPLNIDLSAKSFPVALNEKFDEKMVKENTRALISNRSSGGTRPPANYHILDHQKISGYTNMIDYMKGRLPGVNVTVDGITMGGVNSIYSGTDPLLLRDGMNMSFSELGQLNPNEVSSIEVLKGPDASLYGVRGGNGVIIIHMRKGSEEIADERKVPEVNNERIVAFYKAREFYVPAYESWSNNSSAVPRAMFWRPNLSVDSTGYAVLRVRNKFNKSNFVATVEGISADGSILYYQSGNGTNP